MSHAIGHVTWRAACGLVLLACLVPCASAAAVKKWSVLGPFVIGKNELDGEAWRGSNATELGGAALKKFVAQSGGSVAVSWPEVDWQSLVNGVGGHEILEWQARAVGGFKTDGSNVHISCQGVTSFTLDDSQSFVGDLYWAKLPAHVVKLKAGNHRISIRLRGKLQTQFACHVEKPTSKSPLLLFGDSFAALPDVISSPDVPRGIQICGDLGLGLANQDPDRWIKDLRPVLINNKFLSLAPEQPRLHLAPGQITRASVRLEVLQKGVGPCKDEVFVDVAFEGMLGEERSRSEAVRLRLKCRDVTRQSFVFTFQDADGSLQHAAAVLPWDTEKSPCKGACPVLVTLSGTSITARDSADAYKMKFNDKDPEYRFGIEGAWLLAPTRHGAHNWEGPGRRTALSALAALPQLAQRLALPPVDVSRVVVAGHSMGGHGAWLFAFAHDVLAVVSSASWLRKDQYADSNKVLLHDLATPKVEPLLQGLLRTAEAEFDVEAQAATVAHLPVLIRVGSQDRTVHPWFSRRMYRTLLSEGAKDVTLTELPGKEHWWWDTAKPNDGGAVNDPEIRNFLKRVLDKEKAPSSLRWRSVVFGSVGGTLRHGLHVRALARPERRAEVSVELPEKGPAVLVTSNVVQLQWQRSKEWQGVHQVLLDGQLQSLPQEVQWCLDFGTWKVCDFAVAQRHQRHPNQAGPMREIYSAPLCGVSADEEGEKALQFFGNMLVMTGHGVIRLLSSQEVEVHGGQVTAPASCENLLVVGAPENVVVAALLANSPMAFDSSMLSLGGCSWLRGENLAALSLLPWKASAKEPRLALVATGTSRSAAEALTMLSTPTIPPMARQPLTHLLPDYVVLDVEETRRHGPGGYLAAGFWSNDWQRSPSAYERCTPRGDRGTQHRSHGVSEEL